MGTIFDFPKLILNPEAVSKHKKIQHRFQKWSDCADSLPNLYYPWNPRKILPRNPDSLSHSTSDSTLPYPPQTTVVKEDSSYLSPRELIKKPAGVPFTRMGNLTVEIQNSIQAFHFSPKPQR
jgi:hypothetical protein